nr:diuretic hormone receptor [Hymenolepis microstoma]
MFKTPYGYCTSCVFFPIKCNVLVLVSILYALIFRLKVPKNSPSSLAHAGDEVTNGEVVNSNGHSRKHKFKLAILRRSSSNRSRFRLPVRSNRAESIKSLKACLMLIPLLGIPQVIFIVPYHPSVVQIFSYINAVVTATQGFWVALIYCFLNEEVRILLRKSYNKFLLRNHLRRHRHPSPVPRRTRQRTTVEVVENGCHLDEMEWGKDVANDGFDRVGGSLVEQFFGTSQEF